MAGSFTVRIEGLKPLGASIDGLKKNLRKKLMRSAVAAGAAVVVRAAKANAPVDTGALKKSISSRRDILESRLDIETRAVSVFREYASISGAVGKPKKGDRKLVEGPTFYWKFNELGTVRQQARPFIEPALSGNVGPVTQAMREKLVAGILKFKT